MNPRIFGVIVLAFVVFTVCSCQVSNKSNKYLAYIFNKYGSHGVITFEGLEHLMHSLGIGDLEFSPTHTIDEHRPDGFKIPDIIIEEENITEIIDEILKENQINSSQVDNQRTDTNNDKHETKVLETSSTENNSIKTTKLPDDLWQDISFNEMHDPKHWHHRHHDDGILTTKSCLSPTNLLVQVLNEQNNERTTYNQKYRSAQSNDNHHQSRRSLDVEHHPNEENPNNEFASKIKITPTMFIDICPALLVQIDQGVCSEVQKVEIGKQEKGFYLAWLYSTISIFIISMCGLVGIAIVPLTKSIAYHEILRFLVALAVGTLCGDALMHLLPHALTPHGDDESMALFSDGNHNNEAVWLCACAFMSALFMYSLETLLPLIGSYGHHGHSHDSKRNKKSTADYTEINMEIVKNVDPNELNNPKEKSKTKLSPVAVMVILGDGLHNLTDGMAIGAAFAVDPVTGMATAFAVLCHELPHELGDFALLLQTGVSIRKAIFLNIVSSILSVMGMILGLVLAGTHTSFVRWIYAATAGTFLYIGLADLVPEMGRSEKNLKNALLQVTGIFLGGIIMLAIALHEDALRTLFE